MKKIKKFKKPFRLSKLFKAYLFLVLKLAKYNDEQIGIIFKLFETTPQEVTEVEALEYFNKNY